jgi:integrase
MSAASIPALDSVECDPLRDLRHREARAARDLADWLAWLELGNHATRTLDAYEKYGAALLRAFPRHQFSEFTDGDLAAVLKAYPASSRHIVKASWNNWFRWGYRTRRIPGNPVDLLPDITYRPKRDYDVFTKAEQDALFALPSPDGQLQTILHLAGLRRGEAIGLTGKRIDLDHLKIMVIEGAKGGKKRTVPMVFDALPIACAQLLTLEGIDANDHLWATRPGGRGVIRRRDPISSTTFERWWRRCIETADVRYRNPHMARHSFVTRLRELGVKLEDIKWIVGHESVATTEDTYSHPNMDELGERVRGIVGSAV